MEKNLGPGTSAARATAVFVGVPLMSKAARLHRWAASLELQSAARRTAGGAFGARAGRCLPGSERSPLVVAFEDWAFQAEGLRSATWGDARAFFDLSEGEMRHILGSPDRGSRGIPPAVAAQRIRALAEGAEATAEPANAQPVGGAWSGQSVRTSKWFQTAADYRRESGVAPS